MKNEIRFLGENLYKFRKEKGISQEELANKIGVSRQAVYKWETGERIPDITNLNALCEEFDKRLEDFIEGAEHLVKNEMSEEISQNENKSNLSSKNNRNQDNEVQSKDNRKKIKKIIKAVVIFIFVIYLISVIFKAIFFSTMFAKLNKYKGVDNYTYNSRRYYITFGENDANREYEDVYYVIYKDGVQYVSITSDGSNRNSERWVYYKSPEEKETYTIDGEYFENENGEIIFNKAYYYTKGFAHKEDSPYELTSRTAINNYTVSNILNPFFILKIDFKNKDLIFESYDKDPKADNQVYIKKIKYIDLDSGLIAKTEEYELDELVSYSVYYDYNFDESEYKFGLREEEKKTIIDESQKQEQQYEENQ